jgi:hypothetical protein
VKYREGSCVPLDRFACVNTRSSFVNEVCYDASNKYMVILLKTTWYHYCGVPQEIVTALGACPCNRVLLDDEVRV